MSPMSLMSPIGSIGNYLSKHGFERFEPKAVLFDMDGVLYDSMPHHAVAWKGAMEKYGIHMTHEDAYARAHAASTPYASWCASKRELR